MKLKASFSVFIIAILLINPGYPQSSKAVDERHYQLIKGSENSPLHYVSIRSDVDSTWSRWDHRGYSFGFNPKLTPMYTEIDGIISTPYMIQVRGNEEERNRKRWGYHVFEGYAKDDKSRITMLVNKHVEEDKPVAEIYYYGTVYNHSPAAYNWVKIGSDVKQHSYMFSRDEAIFYGSLRLSNALTLGRIGKEDLVKTEPTEDHERLAEESAKYVNYHSLKNSEDGTIFYDKDNKIVVIKIDGEWRQLETKPLPKKIRYDF